MQKWEYATIGLINSYGLQYKFNGEKQNHWKDHPLHDVLADLGDQGWELLSFDGSNYIFKRPKAAAVGGAQKPIVAGAQKPPTGGLRPLGGPAPLKGQEDTK